MKNFIYYNSVAAHPYHQIGIATKNHQEDGFPTHQTFNT
jgi:hypothetical protein